MPQIIISNSSDRHAILHNWLCNPTGKVDGFRGYDWLMERNNLYTKVTARGQTAHMSQTDRFLQVVFAGKSFNRTMKLVFK